MGQTLVEGCFVGFNREVLRRRTQKVIASQRRDIDRALKLKVYFKFNDTGVVTQMLPESSLVNGYILGQNEDGTLRGQYGRLRYTFRRP